MKEWEKRKRGSRVRRKKELSVFTEKVLAGTQARGRESGRIPSKTLLSSPANMVLPDSEDYEKINFEIPLLWEEVWEANSQHVLLQNWLKFCWSVGTSTSSIFLPPLMAQSILSCKPFSLNKTFPHSPLLLWFTCSTDDVLWVLVIRFKY